MASKIAVETVPLALVSKYAFLGRPYRLQMQGNDTEYRCTNFDVNSHTGCGALGMRVHPILYHLHCS